MSSGPAAESEWTPNPGKVQRFSLQSRIEKPSEPAAGQNPVSILLVEDNPADSGLVREGLQEHGVEGELIVVLDGEAAILFIQEIDSQAANCPHLIIVDLNLPKKPGREVLECIRRSVNCRGIPVAILTSSDAQEDRQDALRLGVSRYLRKPSSLHDFISLGALFKAMIESSAG